MILAHQAAGCGAKMRKCVIFLILQSIFTTFLTLLTNRRAVRCGLPPVFVFPHTPSPLMIHHYHPPTCEANPALTSLHASLWHSRGFLKTHQRRTDQAQKHEVEQIPPLALTHTSQFYFFSSSPAALTSCRHRLGFGSPSRRRLTLKRRDKIPPSTVQTHSDTTSCACRENSRQLEKSTSLSFCPEM